MNSENLKRATHHIVFLVALISGSVLIYFLNGLDMQKKGYTLRTKIAMSTPTLENEKRALSEEEIVWAKTAWKYFENNYNEKSGLVNSIDNFHSTTLWDTGNYMMGLISAYRLNIINKHTFEYRIESLLKTLDTLTLYANILPNKVYDTQTVKMTNYANQPTEKGIGWSAIDIGRLLIPLHFIKLNYPHYGLKIENILSKWNFVPLQKKGQLLGAFFQDEKEKRTQEGRLGYEQYAGNAFSLFAVGVYNALQYTNYLGFKTIYDIDIPYDIRDKENFHANNYVLMEPYMLDGLEFGWDYHSKEFSYRLYQVQEERYNRTGILTAITEDHINQAPYFIYNSIFVNKQEWVAIDDKGKVYDDLKLLSTKASFAMDVLYQTPYTQKLIDKVKTLQSPRGWYAGYYEKDGSVNTALSCNTNAIILESLLYRVEGSLLKKIDSDKNTLENKSSLKNDK